VEPIQQTVAAVLRQHVNDPAIPRKDVVAALITLGQPATRVVRRRLKTAYETFVVDGDVTQLLAAVAPNATGDHEPEVSPTDGSKLILTSEDLHLVCWEYVWS
jgi:hypothetical protein